MGKAEAESIVNAPFMRIVAVVLAIAFAVLAWMTWNHAEETAMKQLNPGAAVAELKDLEEPAAVVACREERFAQIAKMVEDGFMTEEASVTARASAANLCSQRY